MKPAMPQEGNLEGKAFLLFLSRLDVDPDKAGRKYERIRHKLIRFFSWENCRFPEDLADEVINRLARSLLRRRGIISLDRYLFGIARFVLLETFRRQRTTSSALRQLAVRQSVHPEQEKARDATTSRCMEECLDTLPAETRLLIIRYYQGEQSARIRNRKSLALELGISPNAVRNRALRIRQRLEACVRRCLDSETAR